MEGCIRVIAMKKDKKRSKFIWKPGDIIIKKPKKNIDPICPNCGSNYFETETILPNAQLGCGCKINA